MKKNARQKKFTKALGKQIKLLRKMEKMSQAQLAFEVKMSREQLGRIERGIHDPLSSTVAEIAHVLGKSMKEMYDFEW